MSTTKKASLYSSMLLLLLFPLISWGHVHMEKISPAKGETVNPAPAAVQIWFGGGVEAEWSKIEVTDATGKRVDTGEVSRIGDDPQAVEVKLQPLPAGSYKVQWNVIAHDGHRIKGSSSFNVE